MATHFVDHFITPTGPGATSYTVTFDDVTLEISVEIEGPGGIIHDTAREDLEEIVSATFCIDTTRYRFFEDPDNPYATFTTTEEDGTCVDCDLISRVVSISISSTEADADTGSMIINIDPIPDGMEYSLDGGETWQDSNEFDGLAAGVYELSLRDTECSVVYPGDFTISVIPATPSPTPPFVTDTPARQENDDRISRWLAAYNPNVFHFQRVDFTVLAMQVNPDDPTMTDVDITFDAGGPDFVLGSKIYIKTNSNDVQGTVIASEVLSLVLRMTIDKLLVIETGGMIIAPAIISNYSVFLILTIGEDIITASYTPNLKGKVRADVSQYLRAYVKKQDTSDPSPATSLDNNAFIKWNVKVGRIFTQHDGVPAEDVIIDETLTPTDLGNFWDAQAALQFNKWGSNMIEYVPFTPEDADFPLAKFLTPSPHPYLYISHYPFDLSFIIPEELAAKNISMDITVRNINSGVIVHMTNNVGALPVGINRFNFIPEFWLDLSDRTQEFVDIFLFDTDDETQYSEIKRLKVKFSEKPGGNSNPDHIYIKWLNLLGGWDYTLFENRNTRGVNVTGTILERSILDYSTARETQDVLQKTGQKRYTVGKNGLSPEDMLALEGLLYSTKVYALNEKDLNNSYTATWLGVIVDTKGMDQYDTKDKRGDFEIDILFPETNIQTPA